MSWLVGPRRFLILRFGSPTPGRIASARLALARGLWAAKELLDRTRARDLVEQARDELVSTGESNEDLKADVAQWLRRHPAPR